jgi:hypothetical protein
MDIFLDDRPIESTATTLPGAIAAATEAAEGRLLIEVSADGHSVPQEHFAEPPATDPYAHEVRFISADPLSLVRVTLQEAADDLDKAVSDHEAVARMLQVGETAEALPKLSQILAVWIRIDNALAACRSVPGVSLTDPTLTKQFDDAAAELTPKLAEIRDAVTSQDYTAAADVLAYDLPGHAESWAELLRRMSDNISVQPAA